MPARLGSVTAVRWQCVSVYSCKRSYASKSRSRNRYAASNNYMDTGMERPAVQRDQAQQLALKATQGHDFQSSEDYYERKSREFALKNYQRNVLRKCSSRQDLLDLDLREPRIQPLDTLCERFSLMLGDYKEASRRYDAGDLPLPDNTIEAAVRYTTIISMWRTRIALIAAGNLILKIEINETCRLRGRSFWILHAARDQLVIAEKQMIQANKSVYFILKHRFILLAGDFRLYRHGLRTAVIKNGYNELVNTWYQIRTEYDDARASRALYMMKYLGTRTLEDLSTWHKEAMDIREKFKTIMVAFSEQDIELQSAVEFLDGYKPKFVETMKYLNFLKKGLERICRGGLDMHGLLEFYVNVELELMASQKDIQHSWHIVRFIISARLQRGQSIRDW